ncbi:hypothetical protein P8452_03283 [Trifolium repens]|nr:hypothetical protein P8452_03283 [Trifolium repens]
MKLISRDDEVVLCRSTRLTSSNHSNQTYTDSPPPLQSASVSDLSFQGFKVFKGLFVASVVIFAFSRCRLVIDCPYIRNIHPGSLH